MNKHINTDEFIKQLKQFCYSKDQIIEKINGMSSDKVVNLVRCEDCIYADVGEKDVWCDLYESYKCKDGFCDEGEREEKNE